MQHSKLLWISVVLISSCSIVFAGGHNRFCRYRDSGGAYLADSRVLVVGTKYKESVARIPRNEKAVTVLVETPIDYQRIMTDLRSANQGGLPPGSIAVFDFTHDPDPAIKALDQALGRIRIVHDLPATLEQAQAVHGHTYSREQYLAELPKLKALRARLNQTGAHDLGTVKGQVASAFRGLVENSSATDLIVLVGHREQDLASLDEGLPRYRIKFHDGSSYYLAETSRTKPFVWVISCDTWEELASHAEPGMIALATAQPLTYARGVAAAELILGSKTLREAIFRVQKTQQLRPVPKQPAKPQPPPPHDKPRPGQTYNLIVEFNEGRSVGTAEYIT